MAGYILEEELWKEFSSEWNDTLKSQNRTFYHSNNKIYNSTKSKIKAEALYRVIEKYINSSIYVSVHIPTYRNIINKYPFSQSLKELPNFKVLNDPHLFMYQAFFELALWDVEKLGITEPINFIFDDSELAKNFVSELHKININNI